MKKIISVMLSLLLLLCAMPLIAATADNEDIVSFTEKVNGIDESIKATGIVVFPNDTDEPRIIPSENFNFRNSYLLIFNKDGKLIQAGEHLLANTDGKNGSPQVSVTIPAGGFMVGFGASAGSNMKNCYATAFEGAVLYNATMDTIYDVHASFNKEDMKLSVTYPKPVPASENAVKFLFVGNSTTYFNGTPLKFKALCLAAGLDVSVTYCTFGSAYLSEFADASHRNGSALRKALKEAKYDYVVLQDAIGATTEQSEAALKVILPLIEANGAKPLFYMRYATTINGDSKLYKTYTSLGEKYNIPTCRSAVAYRFCVEEREDINLYADDGGHHSAAGSYLIACSWLNCFMGVSPVGNSYIANLEPEVADYLQKTALRASEEEYDPDYVKPLTYTGEDGTVYTNVALKKPYVPTGSPYGGNESWKDTGSDGNPIGKFTDGNTVFNGSDPAIGCYGGNTSSITIDLGGLYEIKRVDTDLFGNTSWGIPDPTDAVVTFLVSEDGFDFEEFGVAVSEDGKGEGGFTRLVFSHTSEQTVKAAYVRVIYDLTGRFCWVSEINAFGIEAEPEPVEESSEEPSEEASEEAPVEASDALSEDASNDSSEPEKSSTTTVIVIVVIAVVVIAAVALIVLKKKKK